LYSEAVRNRGVQLLEAALNDGEKLPAVRRQLDVTRRAVKQPESDAELIKKAAKSLSMK
jgi:hypothetical protein